MPINDIYLGGLVTYIILIALIAVWLFLKHKKQYRQETEREEQEFAEPMRKLNEEYEKIGREFRESVEKVVEGIRSKRAEGSKCQKV